MASALISNIVRDILISLVYQLSLQRRGPVCKNACGGGGDQLFN